MEQPAPRMPSGTGTDLRKLIADHPQVGLHSVWTEADNLCLQAMLHLFTESTAYVLLLVSSR